MKIQNPTKSFLVLPLLASALTLLPPTHTRAAVLIEESFDYTASQTVTGLAAGIGFGDPPIPARTWNFASYSPSNPGTISSGGLSFQNLTVSGNAVSIGSPANNVRRTLTQTGDDGTTYWTSFLMRLNSIPVSTSVSDFSGDIYLTPSTNFSSGTVVRLGLVGGTGEIGIWSNSPSSNTTLTGTNVQVGQTYLLVARIDFRHDGTSNDDPATRETVTLYVNPTPGLATPDVTGTVNNSINILSSSSSRISGLAFATSGAGAEWQFDEFRFGNTYLDVVPVPEPGLTALLIMAGAIGGALIRRRRCR